MGVIAHLQAQITEQEQKIEDAMSVLARVTEELSGVVSRLEEGPQLFMDAIDLSSLPMIQDMVDAIPESYAKDTRNAPYVEKLRELLFALQDK
jgi:hypothetical protein